MQTITRTKIRELVKHLPVARLPLAGHLLRPLMEEDYSPEWQRDLLLISPEERHRILEQQAKQLIEPYQQTSEDRENWQAGNFIDEYKTE